MAEPHEPEHREAERVGAEVRQQVVELRPEVVAVARQRDVEDEQRQRDREDAVGERDRAVVVELGPAPWGFRGLLGDPRSIRVGSDSLARRSRTTPSPGPTWRNRPWRSRPPAAETAPELLAKLLTVDGAGSTLTADALDNLDSSNLFTKDESDDRYPLADAGFVMIQQTKTGTYAPFVDWAEVNVACDAAGLPTVSLKNVSGSNLRVYTDTGDDSPDVNAPLANGASPTAVPGSGVAGSADHLTYMTRGPLGTVTFDVWVEDVLATNHCILNGQAVGQAISLTLAG
jgi:hypothetical protein